MMKKIGYLISFLVLILCFPVTVRALQDDLILKRMGVEQGLSNNYVVDITQDRQGCVWIATEAGLNKFDGKHFTVYNRNNSHISGNEHNTLLSRNATASVSFTWTRRSLRRWIYGTD